MIWIVQIITVLNVLLDIYSEHLIPELWSCSDLETLEMTQSSLLVKFEFVNVKSKIWELN